jgi:Zn-dependent peptidase ImmA (M78 family)
MRLTARSLPLGVQEARRLRYDLGLGLTAPLHDALGLVEDGIGIPVSVIPLPAGVAGAYGRREQHPFIFVSSNDPAVRRRFTLAHELGHHVLGHAGMVDRQEDIYGRSGSPREKSANAFTAEFLAPSDAVNWWMEANGNPTVDLEAVVRLAAYFRISAEAARYRLSTGRFLPRPVDRDNLDAAIAAGGHLNLQRKLRIEPAPDLIEAIERGTTRLPSALRRNVIRAYEAGIIDIDRVADALQETPTILAAEFASLGIAPEPDEPLF